MTYWEKRGAQLEQLADRRTRATAQKVAHLYDEALERIEAKIKKIYTTFTGNSHISEAEATRLMSAQQTKEARRELEALLERTTEQTLRQEIITQLNAPAYGYRIAALEALRDQVYFEAKAIGNDSVAYTESRLKDLYDLGYYRTAFDLSQYEGVNVPFSQLSGGRVEAAINAFWTPDVDTLAGNYSTRIWADTTQLAENVRDIVTRGLMTGGNYADMAAELAAQMGDVQFTKKVEADGSTRTVATGSGAKYRATRLIRTEGNYITGQAKLQSMKDAGYEKYEFICLLETRTCSVCGGLDGKQFPVEEAQPGVNMNPIHPNCRCFVSPVVSRRLMEAGTRGAQVDAAGRKETVPASMTYQEWYEKYVKGNQEMLTAQKMLQNKASDQRQFANYQQVLGDEAPKTFAAFQDLKYNNSESWSFYKLDYQRRKRLQENPELALPNAENAAAADTKFTGYLFSMTNAKGRAKGNAFTSRLGYDSQNWIDLRECILKAATKYPATLKGNNGYGNLYEQYAILYGLNGTPANVLISWIQKTDGSVNMTSAYIKEAK